jgi:hypothetical protein
VDANAGVTSSRWVGWLLSRRHRAVVGCLLFAIVFGGCGTDAGEEAATDVVHARADEAASSAHGDPLEVFVHEAFLVIYLRTDSSESDVTTFIDTVLMKPPVDGRRGQDLADGLLGVGGYDNDRAAWAAFDPSATDARRRAVLEAIASSPLFVRLGTASELVDGWPSPRSPNGDAGHELAWERR